MKMKLIEKKGVDQAKRSIKLNAGVTITKRRKCT